ncbi:hypothetical protein M9434_005288 [Picochlorum sp. BPE23]|nr:hypothetical protein M9434_005288 [Picochlorum sp. BPE23]KAI8101435.1 hypothetical protein M9435_001541 [Picochlorum sp. BPE23]
MDPNAMGNIPPKQQEELMKAIDTMQVRDSLRMYNSLVEKCFKECVESFRRKDLDGGEERCVQNCCSKFMRGSARVGQRFGELSAEAENQMQQLMKQQK